MDKRKKISMPYLGNPEDAFVAGRPGTEYIDFTLYTNGEPHTIEADVYFGRKTTGPPGHVHGGCQAAVLDEMMGSVGWYFGHKVVSRNINVDMLHMVPLHQTYLCVGKITKQEGKKIFVEATIQKDGKVYAQSTGLFIVLSEEQIERLRQKMQAK